MSDIVYICELKNIRECMQDGFMVKSKSDLTIKFKDVIFIYIRECM